MDFVVTQDLVGLDDAAFDSFGQDALLVQPAAVVADFDRDAAGVVVGVEPEGAVGGLAAFQTHGLRLDAVIHRVAHEVRERVADLFDDRLVEFGFGTADFEADVLADFLRDVAHDALEFVEGGANLHHAQLQRGVTHVLDQPVEHRGGFEQFGNAGLQGAEVDAGAGDDQLADQVDVFVKFFSVDADHCRIARFRVLHLFLLLQRGLDDTGVYNLLCDEDFADRVVFFA